MEEAASTEKPKKKRRLSKKQRGFIKDYIATGNGTQAALENYDVTTTHSATVIASENLTKPEIINAIEAALSDELLAAKHLALLNKNEVKRTFDHDVGEWIEVETGQIDANAVSKGLDMAYKIKGRYAPDKHVTLNIDTAPSEELKAFANGLLENQRGG